VRELTQQHSPLQRRSVRRGRQAKVPQPNVRQGSEPAVAAAKHSEDGNGRPRPMALVRYERRSDGAFVQSGWPSLP
jgi:hypothetical protein